METETQFYIKLTTIICVQFKLNLKPWLCWLLGMPLHDFLLQKCIRYPRPISLDHAITFNRSSTFTTLDLTMKGHGKGSFHKWWSIEIWQPSTQSRLTPVITEWPGTGTNFWACYWKEKLGKSSGKICHNVRQNCWVILDHRPQLNRCDVTLDLQSLP